MKTIGILIGRRWLPWAFGVAVVLISVLPLLVFGKSSAIRVHDHLDQGFVFATVLAREGLIFAPGNTIVTAVLGGVERANFESGASLYLLLFGILPPFAALVANEALLRLFAFVGMYLFVRDYVLGREPCAVVIAALSAACFAALPFFSPIGASIAGIPLFAWLVQRVRFSGFSGPVVAGLLLYVLYSSLSLSGVFLLCVVASIAAYDFGAKKSAQAQRLIGFLVLSGIFYVVKEHQLMLSVLGGAEASHREEIVLKSWGFAEAIEQTAKSLFMNHTHAPHFALPFIFSAVALALAAVITKRLASTNGTALKSLLVALTALLATAITYGFWPLQLVQALWTELALPYFNFARFHFFQPALWGTAFAASLGLLWKVKKVGPPAVVLLALAQLIWVGARLPWYSGADQTDNMAFNDFFAPALFDKIRDQINPATSRFGMVGLEPSIAQFNGLNTVDGYLTIYPIAYKRKFRRVITRELARNESLRIYFDEWGSRVYLFASEMNCARLCTKNVAPSSVRIEYDLSAFAELGGTHIISTSRIANASALNLTYLGVFEDRGGVWRLFLYEYQGEEYQVSR